jgi:hypothetical protein
MGNWDISRFGRTLGPLLHTGDGLGTPPLGIDNVLNEVATKRCGSAVYCPYSVCLCLLWYSGVQQLSSSKQHGSMASALMGKAPGRWIGVVE